MNFDSVTVKYSEIKQDAHLADLYSKIYTIPKSERVKVLMSWLANAYSDLLIPFLSESETLETFTVHVRLLDTFSNNSSYDIVAQLASEFSNNFLISQVIPNLIENQDKACNITYYIQVICQNLTCPSLIRKVMDVVTINLTSILVARITSDDHLVASSTLNLIKTLLEFYCEDFWYDLILQYLLPMKHLLTSQRQKLLPEVEFHDSTQKFLELIPNYVTQTTCPSLLAKHFFLYYQDEIMRLRIIDTAIGTSLPSSKSDLLRVGLGSTANEEDLDGGRKPGKNQTYPMWIFRYDGTDFLHALRKRFFYEDPEEFFEDDLFSATNQLDQSTSDILSGSENEDNSLMNQVLPNSQIYREIINWDSSPQGVSNDSSIVTLEASYELENNSHVSIARDKRKSKDSIEEVSSKIAYFGPFLHTLFEILQKWTTLEPEVLFAATEVVSVLASSRIPLISSIFLDMSLTLQPSYPSFSTLIHSLKNELDNHLKTYPDYVFRSVWKAAAKECYIPDFYTKQESISADDDDDSDSTTFVGKLRRSISTSKSLRIAAMEVQRSVNINKKGSALKALTDIFKNSQSSNNGTEFRLLNRAAAPFEREEDEDSAKLMALRCLLFTHWMLELGAIAMQLSWGRRPLRDHENSNFSSDEITATSGDDESSTLNTNSE